MVQRRMLVCHRMSTARWRASSLAARSSGVSRTRSRSVSSRAISISRFCALLRRISVGWAVSTGLTRASVKKRCEPVGGDAGLLRPAEGMRQGAFARWRAGQVVRAGAADMVQVLGDVGEVREVAEGADDPGGLLGRQAVEQGLELVPRGLVLVAMEADGGLADALDQGEHGLAFLGPYRVAEDGAEQADVVAQRQVLVGDLALVRLGQAHGDRLLLAVAAEGGPGLVPRPRLCASGIIDESRGLVASCKLRCMSTAFAPGEPNRW